MSKQFELKDSGTRTEFDTGAVRDAQAGKGRMDLLPVRAITSVARVFEAGAVKYGADNWRKGIPLNRYVDSGMRHLMKYMMGMRDEDHLHQAIWNLMCLSETQSMIEEGLLPAELNNIAYNPLVVQDNPLGIQPTQAQAAQASPPMPFYTQPTLDTLGDDVW